MPSKEGKTVEIANFIVKECPRPADKNKVVKEIINLILNLQIEECRSVATSARPRSIF